MKKVIIEYNELNGEIRDKNGNTVFMNGLVSFDDKIEIEDLVKLKKSGYTSEEIILLKENNLI